MTTSDKRRPETVGLHSWGRRLGFILLGTALALLLIAAVEGVLRCFQVGHPTTLFLRTELPDGPVEYLTNPFATLPYFPPGLKRAPLPERFPALKSPGTYRVFVIGESAAMGEHLSDFSFSRMLEELLGARYPGLRVEVINTGITAINSWVFRSFAVEVLRYEPDLLVVYAGNNEIIGPYGPGTTFTAVRGRAWITLRLMAARLRLTQVLNGATRRLATLGRRDAHPPAWAGMEMLLSHPLPAGDPRVAAATGNFEANLRGMVEAAQARAVPVILCTLPVNLKDCAPFQSSLSPTLSSGQTEDWNRRYARGLECLERKQTAEARAAFEQAARIDATHAELLFRLAGCHAAAGEGDQAKRFFRAARDHDTLRFRITSDLNAAVVRCAAQGTRGLVGLADIEAAFAAAAPGGVTGSDLIYDHVHLTTAGHYRAALALLNTLAERHWVEARLPGVRDSGLTLAEPDCLRRLAYTPWDERFNLEYVIPMMSRPPFTGQFNHAQQLVALRARYTDGLRLCTPASLTNTVAVYREAIALHPDSERPMLRLANILITAGRLDEASPWIREAGRLNPDNLDVRRTRGLLSLQQGRYEAAADDYSAVLATYPNDVSTLVNLGVTELRRGLRESAVARFRQALEFHPGYAQAYFNMGNAYVAAGEPGHALEAYEAAVASDPLYLKALNNMGGIHYHAGQFAKAADCYERILRIDPAEPDALFNLGNARFQEGRIDEAVASYRSVLALNPRFPKANNNLGMALLEKQRPTEAVACFRAELAINARSSDAHCNLGAALEALGQREEAGREYRAALAIDPSRADAQAALAGLRDRAGP